MLTAAGRARAWAHRSLVTPAMVCPARTSLTGGSARRAGSMLANVSHAPAVGAKALQDMTAVERGIEVAVVTASNLVNGGLFGAFFGLISGAWSHRSVGAAFAEAKMTGRSWGSVSGIYAGLQTAARVVRNKDDRYNNIVGACGSGAVFSAKGGPRAAAQGCVSFAALSYLIDVLVTPKDAPDIDVNGGLSDEAVLRKKR